MLRVRSVKIKPGMDNEFRVSWNRYIRPAYEKLAADGLLLAWEFNSQWVVKDPGRIYTVTIANGAEGMDKYVAAINEMFEKNPAAITPLINATEPGSLSDYLANVTVMRDALLDASTPYLFGPASSPVAKCAATV